MTSQSDGSCLKQSLYFVWDLEVAEDWETPNPSPTPIPTPTPTFTPTPTPSQVAEDWEPRAADGEVACFERWDMTRLEREAER